MSDLENSLKGFKDKNFGYYFGKDKECYYIYHTKFGRERSIEINESNDIKSKFGELIDNICKENRDKFNGLKEAFEKYLDIYSDKSTIHIKFDKNGDFLKTKSEIVDNFSKTFGKEKIDQGNFNAVTFKQWWDKSINSARMQGNATNLLKDEKKLVDNLKIIKKAADESENLTKLFEKLKEVEGMKATARELAYFLQFNKDKDKFPLANDAMINIAKYIFEILKENPKEYNSDNKCKEEVYFNFVLNELKI
ncbi:hypothetical protein M9131_001872, partial [Campylobacter coli]|nr:hypothetical protein [Campylobacter coli]